MLRHTFCHLPGVGLRTERSLWEAGIHTWEALLADPSASILKSRSLSPHKEIEHSKRRLEAGDALFFAGRLPPNQAWRMAPEFRRSMAYVDIETTGLAVPPSDITTIALYDGSAVRHYVNGVNLHDFPRDIRDYSVLVTYNGKCFDVPSMERYFGIRLPQAQIDLRYVLRSIGVRGGLKGCEKQMGLNRGDLEGIDGFFAVLLWREFLASGRKDGKALETLLAYNVQDVLNLEILLVKAYNEKVRKTPFQDRLLLPEPGPAANPFAPDRATVDRIRGRLFMEQP